MMHIYKIGGVWGYHLTWNSEPRHLSATTGHLWWKKTREWIERDFYGHGKYPEAGDIIAHMPDKVSGVGLPGNKWQIVKIERSDNPKDMVMGTAEFIGNITADDPLFLRGERDRSDFV